MKKVIIESPYAGNIEKNEAYCRLCMKDCLLRGEAPFASHVLYTQPNVLNDKDPYERHLGITAGFAWRDVADLTVVYTDYGISPGMQLGIDNSKKMGIPIEFRKIYSEPHKISE